MNNSRDAGSAMVVESEILSKWECLRLKRQAIAEQLQGSVGPAEGWMARRIRKLADWFEGDAKLEDALMHPELLSLAIPVYNQGSQGVGDDISEDDAVAGRLFSTGTDGIPTQPAVVSGSKGDRNNRDQDVSLAVERGLKGLVHSPFFPDWRITRKLVYPLVIGTSVWCFWLYACHALVPAVREVYQEFGMELPLFSRTVFSYARLVQDFWYLLVPLPLIYLLAFVYFARADRGQLWNEGGWIDRKFQGSRSHLARWAWHLSLLLEMKVEQSTAMMIAGYATTLPWLQKRSLEWAERNNVPQLPPVKVEFDSEPLPLPAPTLFTGKRKFSLLDYAVSLPASEFKIELLQEVARYYWETDRRANDWWINLLLGIFNTCLVVVILGLLLAIMYPIFGAFSFF